MRAAARATRDDEAAQAERIGDRDDVRDEVGDDAARPARRFAVPRPVDGEAADAVAGVDGRVEPPADPAAGGPVDHEARDAGGIAPLRDGERAPVRKREAMLDVFGYLDVRKRDHVAPLLCPRRQDRDDEASGEMAQGLIP